MRSRVSPRFVASSLLSAFISFALSSPPVVGQSLRFLYDSVPADEIAAAQAVGAQAKVRYVSAVIGVDDQLRRNQLYLDGLETCNGVDRDKARLMQALADAEGDRGKANILESVGLKPFTAQFMTLSPSTMTNVVKMACTKHEKQLQCGAAFEGVAQTRKRIDDLKTIGNHRMMFEKECRDASFVPRVYPCVGQKLNTWSAPCIQRITDFRENRESVNSQIEDLYEGTLARVKELGTEARPFATSLFRSAMTTIAELEGRKCELFKQMRVCVLREILHACGPESMRAVNASISDGFLRTERRERLNLDFTTFGFPVNPFCRGL